MSPTQHDAGGPTGTTGDRDVAPAGNVTGSNNTEAMARIHRAARETELLDEFPEHVACAWIGNSKPVAAKHNTMTTDQHFERVSAAHKRRSKMQERAEMA